ncbi:hypothetical protein ACHAW5_007371 [Stephanodiscus triporus]|uniref:Thiamine-triphosphatase n=1 Tax=Stephanodiscus triporus TaxID=2934178 RepID=A0ABD3NS23_9STRA
MSLLFFRSYAVAFHHRQYERHHQTRQMSSSSSSSELEVEKKFRIPDELSAARATRTLESLGFKRVGHGEEFVDWYFDMPAPHWHFSPRDVWIRYREKKIRVATTGWGWRGVWQVKRGNRATDARRQRESDEIAVYEELQGSDAEVLILNMLSELGDVGTLDAASEKDESTLSPILGSHYGGYDVPYLAGAERLVPFARLLTMRTSYETTNDGEYGNLKVDIDRTDFGHMVGEVEAVFGDFSVDLSHVEAAKEKISKLVDLISSQGELGSTIGKLEYYLINNQRDHYDACVKSGVLLN